MQEAKDCGKANSHVSALTVRLLYLIVIIYLLVSLSFEVVFISYFPAPLSPLFFLPLSHFPALRSVSQRWGEPGRADIKLTGAVNDRRRVARKKKRKWKEQGGEDETWGGNEQKRKKSDKERKRAKGEPPPPHPHDRKMWRKCLQGTWMPLLFFLFCSFCSSDSSYCEAALRMTSQLRMCDCCFADRLPCKLSAKAMFSSERKK